MNFPVKIKPFDFLVIAFALLLTAAAALTIYSPGTSRAEFVIEASGRRWTYPADAETLIEVEGVIGVSMAEISGGSIKMSSSPCANQTCIAAGSINRNGQWIACLPNQVFMHVAGREQSDDNSIDGATW
jgi:hypothetical protein